MPEDPKNFKTYIDRSIPKTKTIEYSKSRSRSSYFTAILKTMILCLLQSFVNLTVTQLPIAKRYDLANQMFIQMLLKLEKSGELDNECSSERLMITDPTICQI